MSKRSGPFWDAIEGRAPVPRAAATLGFEFISADIENGTIELAFAATEDFTNPAGNVLGAFQAAMLFDTVGPALLTTELWPTTVIVVIFFVGYQQLENYFIAPRILRSTVSLSAPAVLLSGLIGGTALGLIGALMAIPVAAEIGRAHV